MRCRFLLLSDLPHGFSYIFLPSITSSRFFHRPPLYYLVSVRFRLRFATFFPVFHQRLYNDPPGFLNVDPMDLVFRSSTSPSFAKFSNYPFIDNHLPCQTLRHVAPRLCLRSSPTVFFSFLFSPCVPWVFVVPFGEVFQGR